MKKIITIISIILFAGLSVYTKAAQTEMSPKEILSNADRARGNIKGIEWLIDIKSVERDRMQKRKMKIKARDYNSLAKFISPAKVKGQKILMIDRNMWFMKPGLRKPVPISPRQKLMGGAANGDIASTNYAGDYKIVTTTNGKVNGESCYVLDLKAKTKKVTYDRIKYWVSKKRLVGVKADFFTISGKKFKSAVFEYDNNIKVNGKTSSFISRMVISDAVMKNNITTMTFHKVKVKKIPNSTFNINLLMR